MARLLENNIQKLGPDGDAQWMEKVTLPNAYEGVNNTKKTMYQDA
ncbi:hypothetical protein Hdeb2414_s0003g00098141 [Helianthus debilis subsp. tardiflorus]